MQPGHGKPEKSAGLFQSVGFPLFRVIFAFSFLLLLFSCGLENPRGSQGTQAQIPEVNFSPSGGKVYRDSEITLSFAENGTTGGTEIWYSANPVFYPFNYSTAGTKASSVPFTFTVGTLEKLSGEGGLSDGTDFTIYALAVDSEGNTSKRTQASFTVKGENENVNDVSVWGEYAENLSSAKINAENKVVFHTVEFGGSEIMNFGYEWNSSLKHAVWGGFYFDSELIKTGEGVIRSDNMDSSQIYPNGTYGFQPDPEIDSSAQPTNYDHLYDGYDRGHIIASADRLFDQTANNQTFYLTNISPQIYGFNQGFWGRVENKVRVLSRNALSSGYSRVYVTKGGDTKNLLKNFTGTEPDRHGVVPLADANGFSPKGIAVPSAYYIVMLAEKVSSASAESASADNDNVDSADNYIVLGFYIPHQEGMQKYPSDVVIQQHVYSIDWIEEKTGLDFFCALPDKVEDRIEARTKETCIANWNW